MCKINPQSDPNITSHRTILTLLWFSLSIFGQPNSSVFLLKLFDICDALYTFQLVKIFILHSVNGDAWDDISLSGRVVCESSAVDISVWHLCLEIRIVSGPCRPLWRCLPDPSTGAFDCCCVINKEMLSLPPTVPAPFNLHWSYDNNSLFHRSWCATSGL